MKVDKNLLFIIEILKSTFIISKFDYYILSTMLNTEKLGMNILVISPCQAAYQSLLHSIANELGCALTWAKDIVKGKEKLDLNRYDYILIDIETDVSTSEGTIKSKIKKHNDRDIVTGKDKSDENSGDDQLESGSGDQPDSESKEDGSKNIEVNGEKNTTSVINIVRNTKGLVFIELVRKDRKNSLIPISIFSHTGLQNLVERGRSVGADDYVLIPFTREKVKLSFRRWATLKDISKNREDHLQNLDPDSSRHIRMTSTIFVNTFNQLLSPKIRSQSKEAKQALVDNIKNNILDLFEASNNSETLNLLETIKGNGRLYQHSLKVASVLRYLCFELMMEYKEEFNFEKEQLNNIFLGGFLHDVGYNGLDILTFKNKKLDPKVLTSLYETHITNAKGVVDVFGDSFSEDTKNIMIYHHETYDGKGPNGLSGTDIPLIGRLAGIVDHFCDLRWNFISSQGISYSSRYIIDEMKRSSKFDQLLLTKCEKFLSLI